MKSADGKWWQIILSTFNREKEFDPVPETEVKWYGVIINIRPQVRKK